MPIGRATASFPSGIARNITEPILGIIVTGQNHEHTQHSLRLVCVEFHDIGVRVRTQRRSQLYLLGKLRTNPQATVSSLPPPMSAYGKKQTLR